MNSKFFLFSNFTKIQNFPTFVEILVCGVLDFLYFTCALQPSRWYGIRPRGANKAEVCRQKGTYVCSQNIFCSQQDQNKHR